MNNHSVGGIDHRIVDWSARQMEKRVRQWVKQALRPKKRAPGGKRKGACRGQRNR